MATKAGRVFCIHLKDSSLQFSRLRSTRVLWTYSSTPPQPTAPRRLFATYTPKPAPSSPDLPPPTTVRQASSSSQTSIKAEPPSIADEPIEPEENGDQVDWSKSFQGLSTQPFDKEAAAILLADIPFNDVEVKPDGIIYLPEIKYRRILNKAFGPGGWGLAPRGPVNDTGRCVTREYALLAHGRLVSIALGEMNYFSPDGIPAAVEGCKSNALMRCCKDLGIASQLWDPRYIRTFMKENARQIWVEHIPTKKKKQLWLRKDDEVKYPYKESKFGA